jgi:hypothetical protein
MPSEVLMPLDMSAVDADEELVVNLNVVEATG